MFWWVLVIFCVCDYSFCSRPETKPENQFLCGLIHRMSIPRYCIPRTIKLQKISDFLYFCPKTLPKWAWRGIFKLNAQILNNLHIIETTALIQTKFCTVTETTKIHFVCGPNRRITNPRWRTAAISKNRKTAISPQRLDRSAQNLARWRICALRRVQAVKISNF